MGYGSPEIWLEGHDQLNENNHRHSLSKDIFVSLFSSATSAFLFLLLFSRKDWEPIWDSKYPSQTISAITPLLRDHITSFSFTVVALFVGILVVQLLIGRTKHVFHGSARYLFSLSFCAIFAFFCWVGMYRGIFEFNGNFRTPPDFVVVDFARVFQFCSKIAFLFYAVVSAVSLLLLKYWATRN